jgi:hypothetical protein
LLHDAIHGREAETGPQARWATFDYIIDWALTAKGPNGSLIEINPAESALSIHASEVIREPAAIALPRVVQELAGITRA